MEERNDLTLELVGNILFDSIRNLITREGNIGDFEFSIQFCSIQEIFNIIFPDNRSLFIKSFPHKNFLGNDVFRLEFFLTLPGDKRGNRVAFSEIENVGHAYSEIPGLVERMMIKILLDGRNKNSIQETINARRN
ncbi:MAG: hypothetical protein HQM10_13565 [Candidatus Riflebacteria bacterium]|nr:hypothetical protein [Candidatus Riflebacteria bacterium]